MLSEKRITLYSIPGDYTPPTPGIGRQWTDTDHLSLGFSWPNTPPQQSYLEPVDVFARATIGVHFLLPPATVKYWPPLPSTHAGIVILTFADGHTESISDDSECQVYRATL